MKPSVGQIVHYVDGGMPHAPHDKVCRAAIVTELHGSDANGEVVSLHVFHPDRPFPAIRCGEGDQLTGDHPPGAYAGTWHWPEREDA